MKQIFKNTRLILSKRERARFRWLILGAILVSLADILFLVGLLWVLKFYIDPAASVASDFLPGWLADRNAAWLIGLFFILFSVKNLLAYLLGKAQHDFNGKVALRISSNSLRRFQRGSYQDFVLTDSSVLIRRIALQPFEFSQYILLGIQQMITQLFLVALAILAILLYKPGLFLLLLVILLPPVAVVFRYIKKRSGVMRKNIRETNERSYQYLLDALKGYVESNVFQHNDFFLRRFLDQRRLFSRELFGSHALQILPARIIEIFAVLGLFILILIATYGGNGNTETLITIGAFMAASYKIIPGIVGMINLSGQMRAFEFDPAEWMQEPASLNNKKHEGARIRSVKFDNTSFHFPGQRVIHELSFCMQRGDRLGISGVSGRGKTTLLNLLLGFLSPESGRIIINEEPVSGRKMEHYWPSISYVRQQSYFIYDTVIRNITLEDRIHDPEKLAESLRGSGLDQTLHLFPEGLNKIISENGKNISGGQQQRIAIARALYKNADLLLLDEPFNELDEPSTRRILAHLSELSSRGIMIILISHDRKALSFCNKQICLDEQA